ncbi:sensor histidine kinase DesK [mine drainage metagenome]|uniref:Sensor histidine kinase DesK n=1 Tax=mine drainage metagenome TaxID=410659 RepID=A0A1J5Q368_9ZZZZ
MASVAGFAAVFLLGFYRVRVRRLRGADEPRRWEVWLVLVVEAALVGGMGLAARESALAGLVFIAVSSVFFLPVREAVGVVVVLVAAGEVLPRTIPGWAPIDSLSLQVVIASIAVFGVTQVMARNVELARARTELADLAVARERERMARDVHDILGHSLTVITVKAELAGRLLPEFPERAAREVADVEQLARAALADVRVTVSGFRAVSLANELASARVALEAAGVEAHLPSAADEVPENLRELFAWTVREGTTNVVRHAAARTCEITLTSTHVRVSDDGVGPDGSETTGSGLVGLRERASAAGARVVLGRSASGGFDLCVELGSRW